MNTKIAAITASFVLAASLPVPSHASPDVSSWLKIQSHNIQQAPNWIKDQAANLRQRMHETSNHSSTNQQPNESTASNSNTSWKTSWNQVQAEAGSLGQVIDRGARKAGQEWFSFINFSESFLSRSGEDWQRFSEVLKQGANSLLNELSSLLTWLQVHVQQLKSQTS